MSECQANFEDAARQVRGARRVYERRISAGHQGQNAKRGN